MSDTTQVVDENGVVLETLELKEGIPVGKAIEEEQRESLTKDLADKVNARQIEVELNRGYRVLKSPVYGELHVYLPTIEIDYQADLVYSEEVLNLMRNSSLPTSEVLFEELKEKGDWTDDHIQKHEKLRESMFDTATELALAKADLIGNPQSKRVQKRVATLEKQVSAQRKEFFALESTKQKFFSLTVEGKAQEKQLIYKLVHCVKRKDGSQLWESTEELEKKGHSNRVRDIVIEFTTFSNGIDPRVLDSVPGLNTDVGDKDLDI